MHEAGPGVRSLDNDDLRYRKASHLESHLKLVASLILRNELRRFLEPCLLHLLEFVDEVCVLDNGSTDNWADRVNLGDDARRVVVQLDTDADRAAGSMFVNHANRRQQLLDFTLTRSPDWILAVDADEFVADGQQLRRACETQQVDALALCLQEVWNAHDDRLEIRQDGGWVEHDVAMLWQPARIRQPLTIVDRGPATGRTPETLTHASHGHTCTALLHFGWANRAERADRHHRYVIADGGRFHNSRHLDSIMWPDEQVGVNSIGWPAALAPYKDRILQRAGG